MTKRELILTLRLPIIAGSEERRLLEEAGRRYTASFNRVARAGWDDRIKSSVKLHDATYYNEKDVAGLPSQLVISARMKAHEALESVRDRIKKGRKGGCPESQHASVRYDSRSATVSLKERTASLATIAGAKRVKVRFSVPEVSKPYLDWDTGSCEVVRGSNGQLTLHVVVRREVEVGLPTDEVVGVDVGLTRPAVGSDHRFHGEKRWKEVERRIFNQRRELQAKGTKSAKRKLRKLSGRLERFRRDCDHVISKRITDGVDQGGVLVLEDLTDIRDRIRAGKAEHRRRLHGWSFAQLQGFVNYKALRRGVNVVYVDPAYSSQTCSRCQHCERANRKSQSRFECKACGLRLNADLNASRNLELRGRAVIATRDPGGHCQLAPMSHAAAA